MISVDDIRRLYAIRNWELRQDRARRRKLRDRYLAVVGTVIMLVGAILWASGGRL